MTNKIENTMLKKINTIRDKWTISVLLFISLVAIYQASLLNSTYYRHVLSALAIKSLDDILFFASMPIVIFCVIFSLLNLLIFPKLIKLIASLLIIISAWLNYFINRAINLLKGYDQQYNTALMYLSDHGESLGENSIYLHGMPYAIAPQEQTQVPLILWLSDKYQQQQQINSNCLIQEAKKEPVSQDNLFHSLLGMFNIETTEYKASLDILNRCQITN